MAHDPASAQRILILRRDNIGDLVCTTPLIAALVQIAREVSPTLES